MNSEVRWLIGRYKLKIAIMAAASVFINLLVFAAATYSMVLFDTIIPSRSLPSLLAVFAIVILVFLLQFLFEQIRIDISLGLASEVYEDLREPVHIAAAALSLDGEQQAGTRLTHDLHSVHSFLASGGPIPLMDLPWAIPILVLLTALDPLFGLVAISGALVLAVLGWRTVVLTERAAAGSSHLTLAQAEATEAEIRSAPIAKAMGFSQHLRQRALDSDAQLRGYQSSVVRATSRLAMAGRLFRLFLQTAMLTAGTLLVINFDASGGIVIAASILLGRALAPVDQAIAQARTMSAAYASGKRIWRSLSRVKPAEAKNLRLPLPAERLKVTGLWAAAPGALSPTLRGLDFALDRGDALAIIGTSAAGKTTLAKVLLGLWPASAGEIRFDGATRDQWPAGQLEACFGYVPQEIDLLSGTVAQNICRFDPNADSDAIIAAARKVGIHEAIQAFPGGYEHPVGPRGSRLSVGQRQRVAIARALYADPFLVVMDEPNSNLDTIGDDALATAIADLRRSGAITIIITQRASVLNEVSHIAVMQSGRFSSFGDRETVLNSLSRYPKEAAGTPEPSSIVTLRSRP